MNAPWRVLVVEDDRNVAEVVAIALRSNGFVVQAVGCAAEVRPAAATFDPDLVVLDVELPDGDGVALLGQLTASGLTAPVIFLSAHDEVLERIRGLDAGGADYVTKPFSLEELVARARAVLLRVRANDRPLGSLIVGDLEICDELHEVICAGHEVRLSVTEYRLLRYLMSNVGRVRTRRQILDHVWKYDFGGRDKVLDTYIRTLRRKIYSVDAPIIQTLRGVGFVMRVPPANRDCPSGPAGSGALRPRAASDDAGLPARVAALPVPVFPG